MNTNQALAFLRQNQPLPPKAALTEELLRQLDLVRLHFQQHPDDRCIPLLIGALGEGDGHGVYPLIGDTLMAHPAAVVVPALIAGLNSKLNRYWSAHFAADYNHPDLVAPLIELLRTGNLDEQLAAANGLAGLDSIDATNALKELLASDAPEVVKKEVQDILHERS